ncbi:hypothetical protein J6590_049118 [Homalodisca vitripennis]|nr:hypothetical protein J6590_049118 [Homalodisca vitripennis]
MLAVVASHRLAAATMTKYSGRRGQQLWSRSFNARWYMPVHVNLVASDRSRSLQCVITLTARIAAEASVYERLLLIHVPIVVKLHRRPADRITHARQLVFVVRAALVRRRVATAGNPVSSPVNY